MGKSSATLGIREGLVLCWSESLWLDSPLYKEPEVSELGHSSRNKVLLLGGHSETSRTPLGKLSGLILQSKLQEFPNGGVSTKLLTVLA